MQIANHSPICRLALVIGCWLLFSYMLSQDTRPRWQTAGPTDSGLSIKRISYNFGENFNILNAKIKHNHLVILGIKNNNPVSKYVIIYLYKITPLINRLKIAKVYKKKTSNVENIKKFLTKMGIKTKVASNYVYGDSTIYDTSGKSITINYSKLIKKLTIHNHHYTIVQQRIGNINKLKEIQTKITITKNDKIIFEKKYPLLIPLSTYSMNNKHFITLCSFKFGLLKSTLEYIINKGLSLECSSLNIETLQEDKLLTTYFDPDEVGNIMRGFPLIYILPIKSTKIDRAVVVLRKKKLSINFCKSGASDCSIEKKTEINTDFPKIVLSTSKSLKKLQRIYLIYNNKIEVINIIAD